MDILEEKCPWENSDENGPRLLEGYCRYVPKNQKDAAKGTENCRGHGLKTG